jgi:hypothetical protein
MHWTQHLLALLLSTYSCSNIHVFERTSHSSRLFVTAIELSPDTTTTGQYNSRSTRHQNHRYRGIQNKIRHQTDINKQESSKKRRTKDAWYDESIDRLAWAIIDDTYTTNMENPAAWFDSTYGTNDVDNNRTYNIQCSSFDIGNVYGFRYPNPIFPTMDSKIDDNSNGTTTKHGDLMVTDGDYGRY